MACGVLIPSGFSRNCNRGARRGAFCPKSKVQSPQPRASSLICLKPDLPADNSDLSSAEMRGQLTSLKDLIDAQAAQIAAQQTQITSLLVQIGPVPSN